MTLPRCSCRRVLAVGFVFLLLLPTMQRQWRFIKESPLGGVEQPDEVATLSWSHWVDGAAETAISERLARSMGFRPICVRTINQTMLALSNGYKLDVPDQVIVGKDDWLYEAAYVQSYAHPQPTLSAADLDRFVSQLQTLQTLLAQRGVVLLLIVSPSKAELYPEHLPDEVVALRKQFTGRRDYEALIEGLQREHINFVDAPQLLRDLRATSEPLFSRTGTHWNYYGCFLVWREAVKTINARSSLHIPVPELEGIEYDEPRGTDNDLGALLNVFVLPSGTPRVPYPLVQVAANTAERRPAFLFVGTSFSWTLTSAMFISQSGAYCDLLYYNKTQFRLTHDASPLRPGTKVSQQRVCSLDAQPLDWSQVLLDKQVVVLEMIETAVDARQWGFCQQAIAALAELPARPSAGDPHDDTARAADSGRRY
jgi:hypothetical protein